jgi:hypothetical protein
MPNNASARRVKDKKNKDKKKKDNKKTDTLPLPKEDATGVDSSTLSLILSSAGSGKSSKDSGPLVGEDGALDLSDPRYQEKALAIWKQNKASRDGSSLSLSSKEQKEQELSLALVRMEKAIQEYVTGEAEEPDWTNAEWAWARTALRKEHANSLTMDERTILRHRLRAGIRESNPLISRVELLSRLEVAMLKTALDRRRSIRRNGKDSSAFSREATDAKLTPDQLGMEQTCPESSLISYQRALTRPDLLISLAAMEGNIQKYVEGEEDLGTEQLKDVLRYEHSMSTTADERTALRRKLTDRIRDANPMVSRADLNILRPEAC